MKSRKNNKRKNCANVTVLHRVANQQLYTQLDTVRLHTDLLVEESVLV